MIFSIKLADQVIRLDCIYEKTYYMSLGFQCNNEPEDFDIKITPEDIYNEKKIFSKTNEKDYEYGDNYYEYLAVYRKIATNMISKKVLLVHGSVVAVNDKGFMFIAPSGVGKSTHTKLWLKNIEGSYVVNGDKPLIRILEKDVYVYGTPWAGKEGWKKNCSVKLSSICIIERSSVNSIEKISYKEAVLYLLRQIFISDDKKKAEEALNLMDELKDKVNFFRLKCNISDEAALLSYGTMNEIDV